MSLTDEQMKNLLNKYERAAINWPNMRNAEYDIAMYELLDATTREEAQEAREAQKGTDESIEEKMKKIRNRFRTLTVTMLDMNSIDYLVSANNIVYDFLPPLGEDSLLLLTKETCEEGFRVLDDEPLYETLAKLIDCENKIAKMCMARIYKLVEAEVEVEKDSDQNGKKKSSVKGDNKSQLYTRIQQYTKLYYELIELNRSKYIEYKEEENKDKITSDDKSTSDDRFTSNGDFDINKFIKMANERSTDKERDDFSNKYKEIIDLIIKSYKPDRGVKFTNFECNMETFSVFTIVTRLMIKMYEYKAKDIVTLLEEYKSIRGTECGKKILITVEEDSEIQHSKNEEQKMNTILYIIIEGYNQPFAVHCSEAIPKCIEKYNLSPNDLILPESAKRSPVTSSLASRVPKTSASRSDYRGNRTSDTGAKANIDRVIRAIQKAKFMYGGSKADSYIKYLEDIRDKLREKIEIPEETIDSENPIPLERISQQESSSSEGLEATVEPEEPEVRSEHEEPEVIPEPEDREESVEGIKPEEQVKLNNVEEYVDAFNWHITRSQSKSEEQVEVDKPEGQAEQLTEQLQQGVEENRMRLVQRIKNLVADISALTEILEETNQELAEASRELSALEGEREINH